MVRKPPLVRVSPGPAVHATNRDGIRSGWALFVAFIELRMAQLHAGKLPRGCTRDVDPLPPSLTDGLLCSTMAPLWLMKTYVTNWNARARRARCPSGFGSQWLAPAFSSETRREKQVSSVSRALYRRCIICTFPCDSLFTAMAR